MNKYKKIGFLSLVLGLVLVTTGTTYAFYNYLRTGTISNTITSGSITMHYKELNGKGHGISITNALPVISNDAAKISNDAFNFNITANTNSNDIIYSVTAQLSNDSDLELGNVVDVYLTEVTEENGEEIETPTQLFSSSIPKYNELSQTSRVSSSTQIEKVIYTDTITKLSGNYNKNFRLRMWIDQNADLSGTTVDKFYCGEEEVEVGTTCTDGKSPSIIHKSSSSYNESTFSVTINVNTYEEARLSDGGFIETNGNFIPWNELERLGIKKWQIDYNLAPSVEYDDNDELIDNGYDDYLNYANGEYPTIAEILSDNSLYGTLILPSDITLISDNSFSNTNLVSIVVPNSVTLLYARAFDYANIDELTLPSSINSYSDSEELFNNANIGTLTLNMPILPFLWLGNVDKLVIGESVTEFRGVSSDYLEEIEILANITEITSNNSIYGDNIKTIILPDTIEEIDDLDNLPSLTNITLPNSLRVIGECAFCDDSSLASLTIPSSVTTIERSAFSRTGLVSITIPSTVQTFDLDALSSISSLENVVINAATISGDVAFDTLLENLTIGSNSSLSAITVKNVKNLTVNTAIIPDNDTCTFSAKNVTLNNTTKIGEYAFYDSTVETVSLPSTLTEVGANAFSNSRLNSLTLPSGLQRIGWSAFADCNYQSVTIPSSVTYLGSWALDVPSETSVQFEDFNGWYIDGVDYNTAKANFEQNDDSVTITPQNAYYYFHDAEWTKSS